jgi:hypothetical protein
MSSCSARSWPARETLLSMDAHRLPPREAGPWTTTNTIYLVIRTVTGAAGPFSIRELVLSG